MQAIYFIIKPIQNSALIKGKDLECNYTIFPDSKINYYLHFIGLHWVLHFGAKHLLGFPRYSRLK